MAFNKPGLSLSTLLSIPRLRRERALLGVTKRVPRHVSLGDHYESRLDEKKSPMCMAYPGPRCASEAKSRLRASHQRLEEAKQSGDREAIATAQQTHTENQRAYLITAEGIKKVEESGNENKAEQLKEARSRLVQASRQESVKRKAEGTL